MSGKGSIRGFDFHCHVDLHPDPTAFIDRCAREGIVTIAVTTTPKAWPQNCEWAKRNGYVQVAAGLHPELVGERYTEANLLERQIKESRFVGEVGLDGSPQHRKSYDRQQEVFRRVLDTSQELGGRVLTIHSRRAARDVITMIEEYAESQRILCILHWFSGSIAEARRAAVAGCYFSVNHAMLAHDRGRKLVQNLPADRLLTETDSPFTAIGERKSLPWDVIATAAQLAEVRRIPPAEMNPILTENAQRVFQFAGIPTCTNTQSPAC
jgi:TatD DNase family protein